MWNEIERYLPEFSSAVLSGLDAAGDPFSLRCQPALERAAERLALSLPSGTPMQPGPACLLCHAHNEHLWNLKSFVLRGELACSGDGWHFTPRQFIPGMGIGGWRSYVHFVRHGRAATRAFFAKRGQPVPRVDLDELAGILGG